MISETFLIKSTQSTSILLVGTQLIAHRPEVSNEGNMAIFLIYIDLLKRDKI